MISNDTISGTPICFNFASSQSIQVHRRSCLKHQQTFPTHRHICHYIFACGFFFYLLFFPRLISVVADWMSTILPHMVWPYCEFKMQIWNVLHAARWKIQDAKNRYLSTIAQLCRAISSQLRHVSTMGKKFLSSNISSTCLHNMVNFGLLAAEIGSLVWGTPANFNGFVSWQRYCTAKLRRWTEGATCIRQGGHHVGHWPTFLVQIYLKH